MHPRFEYLQALTRRTFLRDSSVGLGSLALASLLTPRLVADAPDRRTRWRRGSRTSPAKAKRVIYLHMSGAPPHLDLFDYKPELVKRNGQDCPDAFLKGKRFAFTSGVPKLLGTPQQVRAARQGRRLDVRRDPAPARGRRRAVRHPVDEHRPVQPRPGRAAALHRLAAAGPAVDGLVGDLRARHREREPARLRRADLQRRAAERRQGLLGQRLPAERLPGRAVPLARATRCSTSPTRRAWTATCAGTSLDALQAT